MKRKTEQQSLWGVRLLFETVTVDIPGERQIKVPMTSPQGGLAGVILERKETGDDRQCADR
jgi:hypothetical protein